jgi:hypothetical protein
VDPHNHNPTDVRSIDRLLLISTTIVITAIHLTPPSPNAHPTKPTQTNHSTAANAQHKQPKTQLKPVMRRFGKVSKGASVQVTLPTRTPPAAAGAAGAAAANGADGDGAGDDGDANAMGAAAGNNALLGLEIRPEPMDLTCVDRLIDMVVNNKTRRTRGGGAGILKHNEQDMTMAWLGMCVFF